MLGKPLQGLPQAQLDPGDLVSSSRTWSFFPSSSVCHSFSLKQLPSKWWQRWLPSTASRTAPYNQRGAGREDGGGKWGWVFFLTLLTKTLIGLARVRLTVLEPMISVLGK